ncbi:hypothetical protein LAJ19_14870 (plasmid) [Deinococcus taeanensis]|uniref:hypothetical protein n=1 Tax=Deinococcus taeanensis TaxID=2737050 RepID=UPI001CDD6902|nr:hypothetical protein [Deinococcus taeanensis]UBV44091.1 hypothetical protein LAJ19_14870 [Deinococcus taeanensis]
MSRTGQTWMTYTQGVGWIASHYGEAHAPAPESAAVDEGLLRRFMGDLRGAAVDFQALSDATGVSYRHFRHHLR